MKFKKQYDATNHEPTNDFDPIPPGWYPAEVIEDEFKATKAKTGEYLQLTWRIQDNSPAHGGRYVWDRLNLDNPNPTAVEIAEETLKNIMVAIELAKLDDSKQLKNQGCFIKIKIRPADGQFDASNEITGYRSFKDAPKVIGPSGSGSSGGGGGSAFKKKEKDAPMSSETETPPWAKGDPGEKTPF